jgi:hypothetical protein
VQEESRPEHRTAPRVPLTLSVRLRPLVWELTGHSFDISANGVFIETADVMPVGTRLLLSFTVHSAKRVPVLVEGTVVRAVTLEHAVDRGSLPGIGVRFETFYIGQGALLGDLALQIAGRRSGMPAPDSPLRAPRVTVGLPLLWGSSLPPDRDGFVTNVSATGAYIATEHPEPRDATIHVWLDLPIRGRLQTVKALARVVRTLEDPAPGEPAGMGVAFEQASMSNDALIQFLQRNLARQDAATGEGGTVSGPAPWQQPVDDGEELEDTKRLRLPRPVTATSGGRPLLGLATFLLLLAAVGIAAFFAGYWLSQSLQLG